MEKKRIPVEKVSCSFCNKTSAISRQFNILTQINDVAISDMVNAINETFMLNWKVIGNTVCKPCSNWLSTLHHQSKEAKQLLSEISSHPSRSSLFQPDRFLPHTNCTLCPVQLKTGMTKFDSIYSVRRPSLIQILMEMPQTKPTAELISSLPKTLTKTKTKKDLRRIPGDDRINAINLRIKGFATYNFLTSIIEAEFREGKYKRLRKIVKRKEWVKRFASKYSPRDFFGPRPEFTFSKSPPKPYIISNKGKFWQKIENFCEKYDQSAVIRNKYNGVALPENTGICFERLPDTYKINTEYSKDFPNWPFAPTVLQKDIAKCMTNHDCIVSLPTGAGKSFLYATAGLMKKMRVLVVSPLNGLIRDQINRFESLGLWAKHLTKENSENMVQYNSHGPMFYFSSPEYLCDEKNEAYLMRLAVDLVAFDECHLIKTWGAEFRTSFAEVGKVRKLWPNAMLTCLSATLADGDANVLMEKLSLREPVIFSSSPDRPNIYLDFKKKQKKNEVAVLSGIADLIRMYRASCPKTIIYVKSLSQTLEIITDLVQNLKEMMFFEDSNGSRKSMVLPYNSEMPESYKSSVEEDFKKSDGTTRVIVATSAFGLGIDIPDVSLVVVYHEDDCTQLWQNLGRAGRDGKLALGIVFTKELPSHCYRQYIIRSFKLTPSSAKHSVNFTGNIDERCEQCKACLCCGYCARSCAEECLPTPQYIIQNFRLYYFCFWWLLDLHFTYSALLSNPGLDRDTNPQF